MISQSKSLITIIDKLKKNNVTVCLDRNDITVHVDITKTEISKVSPLLYLLLNKFENTFNIFIQGIPYCLMEDAAHHFVCKINDSVKCIENIECVKCKYTNVCPGWIDDKNVKSLHPKAITDLPREIVFEVTKKCNLDCPICFSGNDFSELSLGRIKCLIDECVSLGISIARFTGGEPLLYKDIAEALHYAKNKGLRVVLNTNATVMSAQIEEVLGECVDDVLISLQGFNSASDKSLTRGKTDFKEKICRISRLKKAVPLVRLGTIISHTLIREFTKYVRLIDLLGIDHWELYRPMIDIVSGEFCIKSSEILKLMEWIQREKLQGKDFMIANPLPFCISKDMSLSHQVILGAEFDDGHSRLIVDTEGFLKPSYCIRENLGMVIKDAWVNPFIKKIHSTDYLPQRCQDCFSLKWCKGGSRHWAKLAYNNYFEIDPMSVG